MPGLNGPGASTSSDFQTLISHVAVFSTVAHNRDSVIAIISLRRRGDETAARCGAAAVAAPTAARARAPRLRQERLRLLAAVAPLSNGAAGASREGTS